MKLVGTARCAVRSSSHIAVRRRGDAIEEVPDRNDLPRRLRTPQCHKNVCAAEQGAALSKPPNQKNNGGLKRPLNEIGTDGALRRPYVST